MSELLERLQQWAKAVSWRDVGRRSLKFLPLLPVLVFLVFVIRSGSAVSFPRLEVPDDLKAGTTTPTTTRVDYAAIGLRGVAGTTTTTPPRTTGKSRLRGFVRGPDGELPGAMVRIERLVGEQRLQTQVPTGQDGGWDVPHVPGGRYRVRAFLPPSYAQVRPEIFFLREGDTKDLDLIVEHFSQPSVAAAIAPNPPFLNSPARFAVKVAQRNVDEEGVVRPTALAGRQLELVGSGSFAVRGSPVAFTDSEGEAEFLLECRNTSASEIAVTVFGSSPDAANSFTVSFDMPGCIDPSATTTTSPSSTTSTTRGSGGTRTTRTTSTTSSTTTTTTTTDDTSSTTSEPEPDE